MHERSVSPVEYEDLHTKTLLDLLRNISEEAEDYASSNGSDNSTDKSSMATMSKQLIKLTNERQATASVVRGPMGNIPMVKKDYPMEKAASPPTCNIQVNVIKPSPNQSPIKAKNTPGVAVKQIKSPTKEYSSEHKDGLKMLASHTAAIPMIQISRTDATPAVTEPGDGAANDGKFQSNLFRTFGI